MNIFGIMGIVILAVGALVVFGANKIVEKYKLFERMSCDFENELTNEELIEYKRNKAILNVKMMGVLISLPGIVIILLAL